MPGFESFLVMVLADSALRDELLAAPDLPGLIARARDLAGRRGIELSDQDLESVVKANRRSWLERWVDF
jgi:hypothetical protein